MNITDGHYRFLRTVIIWHFTLAPYGHYQPPINVRFLQENHALGHILRMVLPAEASDAVCRLC